MQVNGYFRRSSSSANSEEPVAKNPNATDAIFNFFRRANKGIRRFSAQISTAEHHRTEDAKNLEFYGPYAHIRKQLDYTYHNNFKKERQWVQDSIIEELLEDLNITNHTITTPDMPWLIYTVGVKGAGKRHTVKSMVADGKLPLLSYVFVDPDQIRRRLPEFSTYVSKSPEQVDELTGREAGYLVEIVVLAAIQAGHNVIVDGLLHNADWHIGFFKSLRSEHDNLRIAILHVSAPFDEILLRTSKVALETGRTIPANKLRILMDRIPKSLRELSNEVDYFCELFNDEEITIQTVDETWENFFETFKQTCKDLNPESKSATLGILADKIENEEEILELTAAAAFSGSVSSISHSRMQRSFSVLISSEENHKSEGPPEFYGTFTHIRETLDYSYHSHYTRERQLLQDHIIEDMLNSALITDINGDVCTTPTEPWIVFTAGAMGAGKSYTLRKLVENGRFPLLAFVLVDPDEIRRHLPEFHIYVEDSPELAGELTRKESGFIAEILTLQALRSGKNVMVDGSLRDSDWYKTYFERLRDEFPVLRLSILHVTAPRDAIFQRASERALQTGRVVPREILEAAIDQVPRSVKILSPLVDYFCELHNAPNASDIELHTEGQTWETFETNWLQTCAWIPSQRSLLRSTKHAEQRLAMPVS